MLEIKKVESKSELKKFIFFADTLYSSSKKYIPNLKQAELYKLNKTKNPSFQENECELFLALKDHKVVGRVMLINHLKENSHLTKKKLRFSHLDFIEDKNVFNALLTTMISWGKDRDLDFIEGPLGFSNLDKAGFLTEGFDKISASNTIYNYPYYIDFLKSSGFVASCKWVETEFLMPKEIPERVKRFSYITSKKYGLTCEHFKDKGSLREHISEIFQLLNESYSHLENFIALSFKEQSFYAEQFIQIIDLNYLICVFDRNKKMIGFGLASPYMGEALQKSKGKLFPFGWLDFLKARKRTDRAELLLIGVVPKWQKKGVTSLIFEKILQKFMDNKIRFVESNPQQEQNISIRILWKDYEQTLTKKRATFSKSIKVY